MGDEELTEGQHRYCGQIFALKQSAVYLLRMTAKCDNYHLPTESSDIFRKFWYVPKCGSTNANLFILMIFSDRIQDNEWLENQTGMGNESDTR